LQQQRLARSDICEVTGIPIGLGCAIIIGIAVANGKSAAAQVSGTAQPEHMRQQLSSSATLPLGHAAVRHRATLSLIACSITLRTRR
jgi:hypothetical protein